MANVVEILVKGKDQFSGPAKSAQTSAGGLKGAMGGLGKMALAMGVGFIAAQASIAGVQKIMSKSIGAAMKYEHQMAQIQALTGTTEKDTQKLSGSIMDLARTLPKSPAELGAGAYFILSSGIEDVTDAAEVLEVAAKASTIGLGETEVVANALTTVLNAYSMEAGEASHVTDVMIQAVKEGKAEAGEFAGVLGRVVPLAAQMGISFEEVAANLATFTRLGVSADEAATGLRQVMASLLKPSKQAETAMQKLGFSAEGLRQQIREKGLLATLDDMTKATGGNEAAIAELFPNIRALTSILGTAGVQMEGYTDILGATNNATGNLEEGFAIMADTTQFKVQMAMNELNVTLMELGQVALPLIASGAGVASDAVTILSTTVRVAKGDLDALDDSAKDAGVDLLKLGLDIGTIVSGQIRDVVGPVNLARDAFEAVFGKGGTAQRALFDTGEMADRMAERHTEAAGEIEEASVIAVTSLEDIRDMADEARTGLTNMFRETTAEEAGAEAALAGLKLEAGRLENKVGDLTAAEAARLAVLNDELIPAQQGNLDLLRLEKDAVEKYAVAQDRALTPMEAWRLKVEGQTTAAFGLDAVLRGIPKTISPHISLTTSGFQFDLAAMIRQQMGVTGAQHGFTGMVTRPTLFLAGEGGRPEHVKVTPGGLPSGGGGGGGGATFNINFSGPVLGDQRMAMEFAEFIRPELERLLR